MPEGTVESFTALNESPSEKEGKCKKPTRVGVGLFSLNESPSEKEGKYRLFHHAVIEEAPSMKVPPKRKGNFAGFLHDRKIVRPSMKVPPKRKGNSYPKIARNHAAETGASREPRGGYTQNYTLQPHLPPA